MNYTARDLRNNDNHLLRRIERQQINKPEPIKIVSQSKKFNLQDNLREFNKQIKEEKVCFKNKGKSNIFFEETITKLGIRSKRR
jgi:hypothetical protein